MKKVDIERIFNKLSLQVRSTGHNYGWLTVLDRPIESETSKIVENSYRATTLAFLNEWSLFAERNGVDLIKVMYLEQKNQAPIAGFMV